MSHNLLATVGQAMGAFTTAVLLVSFAAVREAGGNFAGSQA